MTASSPLRAPGGFPVVGIIGGGQLARMCAGPASELAVTLAVLSESEDAAAAQVVRWSSVADGADPAQVEAVVDFARHCDVVTFDHEHVPATTLQALVDAGVTLHPRPEALRFAQDKLAMRERLTAMGLPAPAWAPVDSLAALEAFGDEHGWPVILKTPRGGYDGRGVMVVPDAGWPAALAWLTEAAERGEALLAEQAVEFTRELAVLIARSPSGQAAVWPVVETVQTNGICTEVLAPAPGLPDDRAASIAGAALRVAGELDVTGVMAMEIFETGDGWVVNELAMRPHNSGHWTMDGAVTGQFEQHLRAVLDLPLGDVAPRAAWTVMGNVLGGDYPELYGTYKHLLARDPGLRMHLYGKEVRPGRKIGHVNVSGDDLEALRERARHACDYIAGTVTE